MDVFIKIDTDIMAEVLLGAIVFIAYYRLDKRDMLNRAYITLSLLVMIQLFLEAGTMAIDGVPGQGMYFVSYLLNTCLFLLSPILSYCGYLFIRRIILPNKTIQRKYIILIIMPLIINTVFTLLSVKYHFWFYIDEANIYHRGSYFFINSILTQFYLILSVLLTIIRRKLITMQELTPLLLFYIFTTVGGITQVLFYGTQLGWSATALSLVIIYIYLQERMVHLDDLTGTWSRGTFDQYINNRAKQNSNEKIGVIYFDIDDLKIINDKYGHLEGDRAIKTATRLIKNALHKNDVIVRMGGDEFIIILETNQSEVLKKALDRIEKVFQNYNSNPSRKYKLECSFGADMLDLTDLEIEEFLRHIDSTMYENKRNKKLASQIN